MLHSRGVRSGPPREPSWFITPITPVYGTYELYIYIRGEKSATNMYKIYFIVWGSELSSNISSFSSWFSELAMTAPSLCPPNAAAAEGEDDE